MKQPYSRAGLSSAALGITFLLLLLGAPLQIVQPISAAEFSLQSIDCGRLPPTIAAKIPQCAGAQPISAGKSMLKSKKCKRLPPAFAALFPQCADGTPVTSSPPPLALSPPPPVIPISPPPVIPPLVTPPPPVTPPPIVATNIYPGTNLRFHPGHYMLLSGVNTPVDKVIQGRAYVDELAAQPRLMGIATRYTWSELEPLKNQYDFSKIHYDIDMLKRRAPGKYLMFQIHDVSFNDNPNPLPPYLFTAEYDGGFITRTKPDGSPSGFVAKRWNANVSARYQALIRALGTEFKNESVLEAVRTEETAIGIPIIDLLTTDPDFTQDAYLAHWMGIVDAFAASFPNTVTVIFTNWLGGSQGTGASRRDNMDILTDYARSKHVALGGPDLIPRDANGDIVGDSGDSTVKKYPTLGQQYFSRHIGHAPIMLDVQTPEYTGGGGSPSGGPYTSAQMLAFAIAPLQLNYIGWINPTGNNDPLLKDRWAETIAAINNPLYAAFPVLPPVSLPPVVIP